MRKNCHTLAASRRLFAKVQNLDWMDRRQIRRKSARDIFECDRFPFHLRQQPEKIEGKDEKEPTECERECLSHKNK